MEMTLVKSHYYGDPGKWSVLPDSEYTDLQVPDVNVQGWTTCKCYSAYILVQLMCVHVLYVHVTTCTGGSHVPGSYVDVPNNY